MCDPWMTSWAYYLGNMFKSTSKEEYHNFPLRQIRNYKHLNLCQKKSTIWVQSRLCASNHLEIPLVWSWLFTFKNGKKRRISFFSYPSIFVLLSNFTKKGWKHTYRVIFFKWGKVSRHQIFILHLWYKSKLVYSYKLLEIWYSRDKKCFWPILTSIKHSWPFSIHYVQIIFSQ